MRSLTIPIIAACVAMAACASDARLDPVLVDSSFADDGAFDGGPEDTRDDAAQQGACDSCTATGIQRVVTAETDPAQVVSGVVVGKQPALTSLGFDSGFSGADAFAELGSGPLVVTHLSASIDDGHGPRVFYSVAGDSCDVPGAAQQTLAVLGADIPELQTRLGVPAGARLCVRFEQGGIRTPWTAWAGFRPFD